MDAQGNRVGGGAAPNAPPWFRKAVPTALTAPYGHQPPAQPILLQPVSHAGSVTLRWLPAVGPQPDGYQYKWRKAGVGWSAWINIADSHAGTTHWQVALPAGVEHRFLIRAHNAHGAGTHGPYHHPWYHAAIAR